MDAAPLLAVAGPILLFVLPGLGLASAVFPERLRPSADRRRLLVEVATLSVVVSLAVTILVGELLQTIGPGFSAAWADPRLELVDALVGFSGLGVGAARGAFRPQGALARTEPASAPPKDGWETLRALEQLAHRERYLLRRLRRPGLPAEERGALERERELIRSERQGLTERKEREFAT